MQQYRVLVLTDHSNHSSENSLYPFLRTMRQHPLCAKIDVATRGLSQNIPFFNANEKEKIWVSSVESDFAFSKEGIAFQHQLREEDTTQYDLVWLRMPPPLSHSFIDFLDGIFQHQCVINNPKGIYETGSKAFLTNFPELCPPLHICQTKEDILAFKKHFPIVLKPFREYGGKGIFRIDGEKVWIGKEEMTFDHFLSNLPDGNLNYLGVKFLKNVTQGDKRVIVVNGKIMGASLRLPAADSWLCNVAMGGSSNLASVDSDEEKIVARLHPVLSKMGIVMYGVDTLVDDTGKRILSELNTTSIGGLPQIGQLQGQPLVEEAVHLIWQYFESQKNYASAK